MVLHLFHSIHAIQELVCDRVQLQQIHTVERSLQQLEDGGELKRSKRNSSMRIQVACDIYITDPFMDKTCCYMLPFILSIRDVH